MRKISVIGGAGHIGLPFSCFMQNKGYKVTIVDTDTIALDIIKSGNTPFIEEGLESELIKAIDNGLEFDTSLNKSNDSDYLIITIGTSSKKEDIILFREVINELSENSKKDSFFILRSTIDLESYEFVITHENIINKGIKVAYCPERIAEGKALEEIESLPQIIGVKNDSEYKIFSNFFNDLKIDTIKTSIEDSIFIKLFTNAYRYASFNLINEFSNIAIENGLDFETLYDVARSEYPRLENSPLTGMVGGPCLPKDFETFQNSYGDNRNLLSQLSRSESLFLENVVANCKREFLDKKIIQLGVSFKSNSDDLRTSSSLKLYNQLTDNGFEVFIVDPWIKPSVDLNVFEYNTIKDKTENVLIATNHDIFKDYNLENKNVIKVGY
jgi:UDP-N-acetyl-D-mannosaminuronic acid dehydrogenase